MRSTAGLSRWTTVASVLAWALFAGPAPALATHVACGDTITQDTTLDSDLVDCPGNGLLIDGDGVTLDLAGHTIDGDGRGAYGVTTLRNSSDVSVVGGRVRHFHIAVELTGTGPVAARRLEVSESHDGIRLSVTSGVVERVLAWGNDGSGINMTSSRNVLVTDSVMVDNASGIGGGTVAHIRIERSEFHDSVFHGVRFGGLTESQIVGNRIWGNGTFGLRLGEGSAGNLVSRNWVSGSGADGIVLDDDSGPHRLARNRSDLNGGDGFDIAAAGAELVHNRAVRNAGLGFDVPLGAALDVHNLARRNGDPRQCVGIDCGWR